MVGPDSVKTQFGRNKIIRRQTIFLIISLGLGYACNISISPNPAKGIIGDTLNFKVIVKNIHLPCLLAIEASDFKLAKVSLVKETDWETINSVTFEKTITVRLADEGRGEIVISRTCPIRVSETKATIDIKRKDPVDNLSLIEKEIKNLLTILSTLDTTNLAKLKSLRERLKVFWSKNQAEAQQIKQFLAQLDKVLAIADSLTKAAQEALKNEILRD